MINRREVSNASRTINIEDMNRFFAVDAVGRIFMFDLTLNTNVNYKVFDKIILLGAYRLVQ